MSAVRGALARLYEAGWELRRRAYAVGLRRPQRVGARVVSVGNLTVGGTGKTTLALHLARTAAAHGRRVAVVCRRYHPGPSGEGDEERLYREALGTEAVFAGRSKRALAERAAVAGRELVLVDDGFSHWALERDLDLVLLDATDLLGGGRLLPAGRLREPLRALQRAAVVVISRVPGGEDPAPLLGRARPLAPAAVFATGRHRVTGVRRLDRTAAEAGGVAHVVTATGNPRAVVASAHEWGFAPVTLSAYRDHHWFTPAEAAAELARARTAGATLLVTAKDAVRWPLADPRVAVLEVAWSWIEGGDVVERLVWGEPNGHPGRGRKGR